jgi:transcriptional regulator with XRE-family HTH domain
MALTSHQLKRLRGARNTVGNRLQLAIDLAGETQMGLARVVGMSNTYISDTARGRYHDISLEKARIFAEHFGCAIEDLFPAREAIAS